MKKIVLLVCSALAVGGMVRAGLCADDMMKQGQSLYSANCQICHGENGAGNGPAAASLSPKPANFTTSGFWATRTEDRIADVIKKGKGQMPAFDLPSEQIKAIIYYMHQAFKPKT